MTYFIVYIYEISKLSAIHTHNFYIYMKLFKNIDWLCLGSESMGGYSCLMEYQALNQE